MCGCGLRVEKFGFELDLGTGNAMVYGIVFGLGLPWNAMFGLVFTLVTCFRVRQGPLPSHTSNRVHVFMVSGSPKYSMTKLWIGLRSTVP